MIYKTYNYNKTISLKNKFKINQKEYICNFDMIYSTYKLDINKHKSIDIRLCGPYRYNKYISNIYNKGITIFILKLGQT